jgi:phage-related minor tail protein
VFTDVFQGMEDTFVNFAQTGKLSFKSLADSIIGDIARIIAKQEVGGLANLFSSILPFSAGIDYGAASDWAITNGFTLGSLPGFASGGAISGPAIVGENGPELFVPDTSGFVVPNNKLSSFGASGPAVTVNQTIHVGAGVDRATMAAALEINRKQTVATVSNLIKGGAYRK